MKAVVGHFEVPARDPRGAGEFFTAVFGWAVEPVEWNGPAYCKVRSSSDSAGALQGGLLDAEAAGFAHPLPVIHLSGATLEECLERVEAAGGTTVEGPREVAEMGRFARFRDPEGHEWGLWTGAE